MAAFIIRKLEQVMTLSSEERRIFEDIARGRVRLFRPREDILHEGDPPRNILLFLDGWAYRYKTLMDGRRQIVDCVLPGDICGLNVLCLPVTDYSIATLTPSRVAELSRESFEAIAADYPQVARAFWCQALVTASIQREWTVSLGQRTAFERIAHLFCELFWRLRAIGLTDGDTCVVPLTQIDLGAAVGLSTVHVNRSIQQLRGAGLITWQSKTLVIHNLEALQQAAFFNPNYLYLQR
jgi:CRP-like cAMP-binding protein